MDFIKYLHGVRKKNGDKLTPVTIENYSYLINQYEKELSQLKEPDDIINYMNEEIKKRRSFVLMASFRSYLGYRGFDVTSKMSIANRLEKPKEIRANASKSMRFLQSKLLSRGELKRLFSEVKTDKDKLIISVLYDTAGRAKEIMNIKYGDIVFTNPQEKELLSKGIYASISILGKGQKSRTVYFGKTTVKLIYELTKGLFNNNDYLIRFYKNDGKEYKFQKDQLYKYIKKIHKKILDRHVHPHCYRHTKLTHMCDDGAELLNVSKYAGHTTIKTTEIYLHVSTNAGMKGFASSKDIMGD